MQIKTKGGYVMQKLKGLWIPADILLNKELSDKEKIILSGVRIDIWTHFMRVCIIDYVH